MFKPFLGSLIGSPSSTTGSGTGLLSFLSSKDWPLRKASAESLSCIAIIYGPELSDIKSMGNGGIIGRCKQILNAARFDKVRHLQLFDCLILYFDDKLSIEFYTGEACSRFISASLQHIHNSREFHGG